MSTVDLRRIQKIIKGATKPNDAPPKEKYLSTLREYLAQKFPISELVFSRVSQFLIPKLDSPSSVVSLKAHLVFHRLIADPTIDKYAFLSFISRQFTSAQRSSVDSTVGAGSSTNSVYIPSFPAGFASNLASSNRSVSNEYLDLTSELEGVALDSFLQETKKPLLPNLAHSIPQSLETNRLISAYNRYLRERIIHFRRLRLDPILEKVGGASIIHDADIYLPEFSRDLLTQIQCVLQQIRLVLACIFTSELLQKPLYAYFYDVLATDLSHLFWFLNIALVVALQNFFTLSRSNAERTLFVYKEYTQLQIRDEVIEFVNQAPNSVSVSDLVVPQALQQDKKSVIALTKSLENYLYDLSIDNEKKKSLQFKKLSDSDISDFQSENRSMLSLSSVSSTSPPHHSSISKKSYHNAKAPPPPISVEPMPNSSRVTLTSIERTPSNGMDSVKSPTYRPSPRTLKGKYNRVDRSYVRHTINKSPFDPLFDEELPPTPVSTRSNGRHRGGIVEPARVKVSELNINRSNSGRVASGADLSNPSDDDLQVPHKSVLRKASEITLKSVTSGKSSDGQKSPVKYFLPPSFTALSLPQMTESARNSQKTTLQSELPEGFNMKDPSMENWSDLFESLNNPEATFSLKFDMAAALQRSIRIYEENLNSIQQKSENNGQQKNSQKGMPDGEPQSGTSTEKISPIFSAFQMVPPSNPEVVTMDVSNRALHDIKKSSSSKNRPSKVITHSTSASTNSSESQYSWSANSSLYKRESSMLLKHQKGPSYSADKLRNPYLSEDYSNASWDNTAWTAEYSPINERGHY